MINFLKKLLPHFESQIKEGTLEDVVIALNDSTIRKYWIQSVQEKIEAINSELDNILSKPDKNRVWETLVIERRTLLRSLTMILDSRDKLESERVVQESQNRLLRMYQGAAAPLNLDNRANNPARD